MRLGYLAALLVGAWLLACQAPLGAGAGCVRDAQCGIGLVCALGRCRAACRTSRDCAPTERCLVEPATGLSACSIAAVDACAGTTCADGLVCRSGDCVNLCGDVVACPDGVCEGDVCAAVHGDAGAFDAGPLDDVGTDAGPVDAGPTCHGPACDPVVHVSVGDDTVYATTTSGALWTWGNAIYGVLGDGLIAHGACADCSTVPVRALDENRQAFADVLEARGGGGFACARRRDRSVWCWGRGYAGQLGDGRGLDSMDPVRVLRVEGAGTVPVDDATAIFTAGNSSCLLRGTPAQAWCWGEGTSGRLGTGDAGTALVATLAAELGSDLVTIEIADLHAHSLARDGTVRAVGNDRCGVVGTGTPGSDTLVGVVSPGTGATAMVTSLYVGCVLTGASQLSCWGEQVPMFGTDGTFGACTGCPGACTSTPVSLPTPPGHDFVRLTGHSSGTFFGFDAAGHLFAFGGSYDEPYDALVFPTPVLPDRTFLEVSSQRSACAVTSDGDLLCWGAGDRGQLGRGTTTVLADPTPTSVWP